MAWSPPFSSSIFCYYIIHDAKELRKERREYKELFIHDRTNELCVMQPLLDGLSSTELLHTLY